jgi:intergrase/recombinase
MLKVESEKAWRRMVQSPGFEPVIISLEGSNGSNCLKRFDSGLFIDWRREEGEFVEYLNAQHFNAEYTKAILRQLVRFVPVIREPMDIVKVCVSLTDGQKHNLNRALSALFRFYELKGVDAGYLGALRKAIPKDNIGVDLNVPIESEILANLKKVHTAPLKYQALYNLLLDSGLRVTEAVRLMAELNNGAVGMVEVNGFCRCTLGYFRGSKLAYAAYFTPDTFELVKRNRDRVDENAASHYAYQFGLLAPKYYRKFAFDTMISETLSIPESVADFIEGRVPKKIGAKHYTALLKQADGFYPKYAKYISALRNSIVAENNKP